MPAEPARVVGSAVRHLHAAAVVVEQQDGHPLVPLRVLATDGLVGGHDLQILTPSRNALDDLRAAESTAVALAFPGHATRPGR